MNGLTNTGGGFSAINIGEITREDRSGNDNFLLLNGESISPSYAELFKIFGRVDMNTLQTFTPVSGHSMYWEDVIWSQAYGFYIAYDYDGYLYTSTDLRTWKKALFTGYQVIGSGQRNYLCEFNNKVYVRSRDTTTTPQATVIQEVNKEVNKVTSMRRFNEGSEYSSYFLGVLNGEMILILESEICICSADPTSWARKSMSDVTGIGAVRNASYRNGIYYWIGGSNRLSLGTSVDLNFTGVVRYNESLGGSYFNSIAMNGKVIACSTNNGAFYAIHPNDYSKIRSYTYTDAQFRNYQIIYYLGNFIAGNPNTVSASMGFYVVYDDNMSSPVKTSTSYSLSIRGMNICNGYLVGYSSADTWFYTHGTALLPKYQVPAYIKAK